ncbi:MAG TPA: hypothetical protein DEA96_05080 [Leptospiraceae bacterium]|nr:hypothetical protein [Spirochaetaceae bacterium]HBS04318.1 hypothetical protein [Leptospiraceae bacterium]|tara:strand:- start:288 stop:563 length:276 start_codon:yes stop_codon:yes gene_type:complete
MEHIDIRKFGLAFGLTGALLYGACIIVMAIAGKDQLVFLFNSLLHGIDVSTIIEPNVPTWQALMGIVETFVVGWLIGACIASIYNFSSLKK